MGPTMATNPTTVLVAVYLLAVAVSALRERARRRLGCPVRIGYRLRGEGACLARGQPGSTAGRGRRIGVLAPDPRDRVVQLAVTLSPQRSARASHYRPATPVDLARSGVRLKPAARRGVDPCVDLPAFPVPPRRRGRVGAPGPLLPRLVGPFRSPAVAGGRELLRRPMRLRDPDREDHRDLSPGPELVALGAGRRRHSEPSDIGTAGGSRRDVHRDRDDRGAPGRQGDRLRAEDQQVLRVAEGDPARRNAHPWEVPCLPGDRQGQGLRAGASVRDVGPLDVREPVGLHLIALAG